MAWALFKENAWRVRLVAGMGGAYIAGIESAGVIERLERRGLTRDDAEDLVAACERGFVEASNRKDDEDGAVEEA